MESIGAVILAGGKSRRMGRDKAALPIQGQTFLDIMIDRLNGLGEVLLSVDEAGRYEDKPVPRVKDLRPGCGPIGGLWAALGACSTNWLFAVGCDTPMVSVQLVDFLASYLGDHTDAVVAVTRDGRVHPLCAIYSKDVAPVLESQIAAGNYRLTGALEQMRTRFVHLRHTVFPDEMLFNVNTMEQFRRLRRMVEGPPILAICGVKNAGKTTLIEGILPHLNEMGVKTAVIKHDGHDFDPDVPGTDSYRLRHAGALGVAVYSARRYSIAADRPIEGVEALARYYSQADLILLEGGKSTAYPKIEVVRGCISPATVCDPRSLVAICTDLDLTSPVPLLSINDHRQAARLIADFAEGGMEENR